MSNVVAFLAAVLYGGALKLEKLFGWDLWFAIILPGGNALKLVMARREVAYPGDNVA